MTTTISKPVVVVSGFKPFGYESPGKKRKINASWIVAEHIKKNRPTDFQKVQFKAMELKVKWGATYRLGKKKPFLGREPLIYKPDIWIAFGESDGSKQFEIELKADPKNFLTKRASKNGISQNLRTEYPGKDERWTNNLQMCAELACHLNGKEYPTVIDSDASRFICEQMLYTLLSVRTEHKKLSFFIHVPTEKDMEVAKLKSFGLEVFDYVVNTLYPKI